MLINGRETELLDEWYVAYSSDTGWKTSSITTGRWCWGKGGKVLLEKVRKRVRFIADSAESRQKAIGKIMAFIKEEEK